MKKEGFLRTFHTLQRKAKMTDAQTQFSALYNPDKEQLGDAGVHHYLNVWHGAKNLSKRILAGSNETIKKLLIL